MMTLFSRIKGRKGRVTGTVQHTADVIPIRPNEPDAPDAGRMRVPACWRKITRGAGDVALTAVISAALTCLVLLVGVLLFGLAETGSAADWLAVVTNSIVAVGAVGAFIVARRWLPQLTTQEGYKEAIRLVNDHYISLSEDNRLLADAKQAKAYFDVLHDDVTTYNYGAYMEAVDPLTDSTSAAKTRQHTVARIAFRLNTYGLQFSDRYKTHLEHLEAAFRDTVHAAAQLESLLSSDLDILHRYTGLEGEDPHISGKVDVLWEERHTLKSDVDKTFERLQTHWYTMTTAHARIFTHKPAIGDLFVVRRR
ncbi:hypothetical protein JEM67_00410 (plasmid) [Serratia sp. PAMC26656]|uniref:hypothetical protein n=1 Tax=Serratia sp. PAMC26656 TaxID=2775909 RepID=UPI0018F6AE7C|nr:hypothetical protein [Serratia sp. PAMC26656]MBJ7889459.1 hypothetical protein [Serratia sp. PAMC26656]